MSADGLKSQVDPDCTLLNLCHSFTTQGGWVTDS